MNIISALRLTSLRLSLLHYTDCCIHSTKLRHWTEFSPTQHGFLTPSCGVFCPVRSTYSWGQRFTSPEGFWMEERTENTSLIWQLSFKKWKKKYIYVSLGLQNLEENVRRNVCKHELLFSSEDPKTVIGRTWLRLHSRCSCYKYIKKNLDHVHNGRCKLFYSFLFFSFFFLTWWW